MFLGQHPGNAVVGGAGFYDSVKIGVDVMQYQSRGELNLQTLEGSFTLVGLIKWDGGLLPEEIEQRLAEIGIF